MAPVVVSRLRHPTGALWCLLSRNPLNDLFLSVLQLQSHATSRRWVHSVIALKLAQMDARQIGRDNRRRLPSCTSELLDNRKSLLCFAELRLLRLV